MSDKGYNGWSSYETWVVALWVDNEEWSYHERRDMAERYKADPDDAENEAHVSGFAEALHAWVFDTMLPEDLGGLAGDLLTSALGEVNWHEIAENWLEE